MFLCIATSGNDSLLSEQTETKTQVRFFGQAIDLFPSISQPHLFLCVCLLGVFFVRFGLGFWGDASPVPATKGRSRQRANFPSAEGEKRRGRRYR